MPTEAIRIPTEAGHELSGSLELPTGLVRGAALFAHCFTCTKQCKAAVSLSRALARRGIATLRFDFTGLGNSDGQFGHAGFTTDIADLVSAANFLHGRFPCGLLLIGHSLGGAGVLAAADDIGVDKVAAIATIGAPAEVEHVLHNIEGDLEAIRRDGIGKVSIGGRSYELTREFIDRVTHIDLLDEVSRLRVPMMFLHSPTDQTVGIENATKLFLAARHPKNFVSLYGADHLLTNQVDADFAADVIAAWADRYMAPPEPVAVPDESVLVRTGYGKFGTEIMTGTHQFVADEPKSYGGEDGGPTPYQLLLSALGACTAMTMKMYADRKRLPLEEVRVTLNHTRHHEPDVENAVEGTGGRQIEVIHRKIGVSGDLTDEEREAIMAMADKCPVHRTLNGNLEISTEPE